MGIGLILRIYGIINNAQLESALSWQGLHPELRLSAILVHFGYCTSKQIEDTLSLHARLSRNEATPKEQEKAVEAMLAQTAVLSEEIQQVANVLKKQNEPTPAVSTTPPGPQPFDKIDHGALQREPTDKSEAAGNKKPDYLKK